MREWGLARDSLNRGTTTGSREGRPSVSELRQLIRLKADLLARLDLKRSPAKVRDLRDAWTARDEGPAP